jgi:hypothetical protein
MNWEIIGSIAEMIGAIGVILSLLYVGRQLRQSNSMARSAARMAINSSLNSFATSIATSSSLSDAISKAQFHDFVRSDASDREKIQIGYSLVALVSQQHFIYEQWKEGVLTESEMEDHYKQGVGLLRTPYLRSAWPVFRGTFPDDFAEWYEERYRLIDSD